ncbi:MAG: hypothetical protein PHY91_08420 [Tissierellia bacterium]|nr:hypothetical protein [Tissierellia bacterium]MDD4725689.1 hypothetical protein [Tissierellia bacterium]
MIIHIGDNISLDESDIIVILNRKTVNESKKNSDYINYLIENDCLVNDVVDIKTYIISKNRNKKYRSNNKDLMKLYVSNISSNSLLKRSKELDRRENYGQ